MSEASKIISSAILGLDFKTVEIGGRIYVINPPTIERIVGASYYLSDFDGTDSIADVIKSMKNLESLAKAVSWFINGSEKLSKALMKGTLDELVNALSEAYSLISVENFLKLSALARNVGSLTAKSR